jgi:hypothetical protein
VGKCRASAQTGTERSSRIVLLNAERNHSPIGPEIDCRRSDGFVWSAEVAQAPPAPAPLPGCTGWANTGAKAGPHNRPDRHGQNVAALRTGMRMRWGVGPFTSITTSPFWRPNCFPGGIVMTSL